MVFDWLLTLYTAITAFFAAIIHGVAGFGLAQISMGILPLFRSVASASVITGILAIVSNFRVWYSARADFDWKAFALPFVGLIVGMPIGLLAFENLDENQAKKAVGIIILLAVVTIVLGKQTNYLDKLFENVTGKYNKFFAILAGLLGGILGGAVSIPGPPMIVYGAFMTSTGEWSGKKTRCTFTAFFGLLQLYRTGTVALRGDVSLNIFLEALVVLPAMLLGTYVGIKIFDRVSNEIFNWVLITALTANAIVLLIQ